MKYMRGFGIIMSVSFAGEILRYFIPLKIPASIYGFIIMIILLRAGIVKLNRVKETSVFLIEIMPIMFVPPAVGLMVSYKELEPVIIPFLVVVLVSTVIVMVIAGHVTQLVIRKTERKSKNERIIK